MSEDRAGPKTGRGPIFWAALFFAAMGGAAALKFSGAIEGAASLLLMIVPMILLVPMVRAAERKQAGSGCISAAVIRYNGRMLWAAFAYVLGLGIAITLDRQLDPGASARFALALLPILPIFAMIWSMGRYLIEEHDEYLRHRTIMAALGGLGLVLGLGSFWGFLETFGLAPHAPGWWTVPVFALGLALGQLWMKVSGK
jgi:hypothetical protein